MENHRQKAVIMDADGVKRVINRLSFEIIEKNKGAENIILAGIKTRGAFIAERIAQKIAEVEHFKPLVCALDITAFRDDVAKDCKIEKPILPDVSITDKTVIIVDDVLFTGRTVRAAIEALSFLGRAEKIQLVTLIDRGHRELPLRCDYVGKNLPTSISEKVRVQMKEVDGQDGVVIWDVE